MPDWRSDYISSLQEAERNNPVNKDLVQACSQLADRIAALEAEKAVWKTSGKQQSSSEKPSSSKAPATTDTTTNSDSSVAQLRLDLAEALRSKGQLQNRLKTAEDELQKLRTKTKVDTKRISDLTIERNAIAAKLGDRNEELIGKNKMLKDIQDDNLTLNIQLDVTEQKAAKLTAENKDLVKRWMERMRDEADAMNMENETPSSRNRR
ncbi:autophagy protein 16 [Annulohypoxylon maeteangense]|uniref:autophagy protein 16 n=1 Tax=Annulohypoxylon maeteangense TaxID=1927788 RepID=UPI0020080C92|nr:autophagy protein 16 [Annulohypoxylon maeteangense]KAI0881973.1 autophagy protein 16 [Annulohypoxylon maeteangense]